MKRWNITDMVSAGRKLFAKVHKQKHHANPNHDVQFMARDIDDWLVREVESILEQIIINPIETPIPGRKPGITLT